MAYNLPATRLLMNRLRQIMAEDGETRSRLDNVVRLIASTMVADVCSIYLRHRGGQLILIATEGLKPEAVGNTRLSANEGLVGLVSRRAEPMAIQDAPRHPSFSYRPETGEDPFHAFLGVPILRGGRVIGVLTVQNRTERVYGDEEIDSLQTIAMVLAEIVDRIDPEHLDNGAGHKRTRNPASLRGRVFCEGLGYGRAVLHDPVVPAAKFFAGDQEVEAKRLTRALIGLKASIDRMMAIDGAVLGREAAGRCPLGPLGGSLDRPGAPGTPGPPAECARSVPA
jgi:phosphotransferase system enzyme I (PtsP)